MVTRSRHVAALVCGSEIATSHCNIVCNYLLALRSIKKLPAPRLLERIIDPHSLYTCIYIYIPSSSHIYINILHPLHTYIEIYIILFRSSTRIGASTQHASFNITSLHFTQTFDCDPHPLPLSRLAWRALLCLQRTLNRSPYRHQCDNSQGQSILPTNTGSPPLEARGRRRPSKPIQLPRPTHLGAPESHKLDGVATKWMAGENIERLAKRLGIRTEIVKRYFRELGVENLEGKIRRLDAQRN